MTEYSPTAQSYESLDADGRFESPINIAEVPQGSSVNSVEESRAQVSAAIDNAPSPERPSNEYMIKRVASIGIRLAAADDGHRPVEARQSDYTLAG